MAHERYNISGDGLEAFKELAEITGAKTGEKFLADVLNTFEDIIRKKFNKRKIVALTEDQIQILKDNGVILHEEDFYDDFILPDKYEMAKKYFEKR